MRIRSLSQTGVVRASVSLPDLFIEREIAARVAGLQPLELIQALWEVDLGGRRVHRLRERVVRDLAPNGWRVTIAEGWEGGWEAVLAGADAAETLHVRFDVESAMACAYARTRERAQAMLDEVKRVVDASCARRADGPRVLVRFWYLSVAGPASFMRRVCCPRWSDIADNYPACGASIAELAARRRPYESGHFVFWHGPAGTGKTSALRALMREWRDMDIELVTDPDAFLASPEYLNHLLVEPTHKESRGGQRTRRGRLLVLEDAPELLQAENGAAARATLAKLLNVSDGVLRHELRLVVLATTHERCEVRESALTRPGRCLQVLEFPRLDARQTEQWLARRSLPTTPKLRDASLAELYARGDQAAPQPFVPKRAMGF